MATLRPVVSVYGTDGNVSGTVPMPPVFGAPIRVDVVHSVHTNMAKNKRQAYAVSSRAGEQTSAESWGTGRAVSRIPRVRGGGTHRSGEGAFGNMCRGGRMYNPTKIWRRWHRKINLQERRVAMVSAIAATAVVPLVLARGHRVQSVKELPLVLSNDVQSITKTANAAELLRTIGVGDELDKVKDTKKIRRGKGKMRNRRYVQRKGPLIIYREDNGLTKAFRNLPGVDLCHVERLNLLQLAPGGHLGRFCIWIEDAFRTLDALYGSASKESEMKKGFKLPRAVMTNANLARLINSSEIQSVLRAPKMKKERRIRKKNPLKNLGMMLKLNPHALTMRRRALAAVATKARRAEAVAKKRRESKEKSAAFRQARHAVKKEITESLMAQILSTTGKGQK